MFSNLSASSPTSRIDILLINFHSAHNAGDSALLEAAIRHLQTAFPDPHVVISANYPDEEFFERNKLEVVPSPSTLIYRTSSPLLQIVLLIALWVVGRLASAGIDKIQPLLPSDWRDLLQAYSRADLVIGCPGNQFFSMGNFGWPLLVSGLAVQLAHLFKKPFYVLPQSLGPLKRRWERSWMRQLYGKARLVYLRDSISLALAREIGLPEGRLHLVSDLAFEWQPGCLENPPPLRKRQTGEDRSGMIGVTVIRRMVKSLDSRQIENYYRALAGALSEVSSQFNLDVFFLPQVTGPSAAEDDRLSARQVAKMMKIPPDRIHFVDDELPLMELKAYFPCMDIFVASRLHSGVFAIDAGVPTLFIGYLTKTQGILHDLGMDEWLIELSDLSESSLTEKLQQLWMQRMQLSADLAEKIPAYAHRSIQVGHQIYQDYLRASER